MTNTNVIPFPKTSKQSDVPSPQQAFEKILEAKEDEIDILVDIMCASMIDLLIDSGFPVANNEMVAKDLCLVVESIRSLINRFYDLDHPFNELSQSCFEIKDDQIIFNSPKLVKLKEDLSKE